MDGAVQAEMCCQKDSARNIDGVRGRLAAERKLGQNEGYGKYPRRRRGSGSKERKKSMRTNLNRKMRGENASGLNKNTPKELTQ